MEQKTLIRGRGAQYNTPNRFLTHRYGTFHTEGIDEPREVDHRTQLLFDRPKTIVNHVDSPDIGPAYSMNPYQGCEHGCIYCYARNSHEFWGYSAGTDFEQKIIVKENAPELLEKFFQNFRGQVKPVMLSGNTDCYQPAERRLGITRKLLQLFLKHRYPVSIITKNSLILRDLDVIEALNRHHLVRVNISITSMDEGLRRKLEPRTATCTRRLEVVRALSEKGIPVNVMAAPVIPGLNDHELPEILKQAAQHGAASAAYTMVRLNGSIQYIFEDWIRTALPEKADKVLNQIREVHGGKLTDSRWATRMRGEGKMAEHVRRLFEVARRQYFGDREPQPLNCSLFRNLKNGQFGLFE